MLIYLCWPRPDDHNSLSQIQWCAGHSDSVHVNPTPHIFVISQPKWLKFGLQPHFFKMFLYTKFQLSISVFSELQSFQWRYLLISFHFHQKLCNSKSTRDGELKFCMSKHLAKMWLEIKFQPFRLRNDRYIERETIDIRESNLDSSYFSTYPSSSMIL